MEVLVLYQLFECLTVIFEMFVVYLYLDGMFARRNESKGALLWYIIFCGGLILLTLFFRISIILIAYTFAGLYVLSIYLYKTTAVTRIFAALYFAAIMVGSEIITPILISAIWKISLSDAAEYGLTRVFCIVVAKLIQLFLVKASIYVARWNTDAQSKKEIAMLIPLLLCQCISVLLAHYVFSICYEIYNSFQINAFFSIAGIMFINIVIFWYFDRVKAAFEYKSQIETAELKLYLQKQYHEVLVEHQRETDALWHDMKKHISLMKLLLRNGYHKITSDYIEDLEEQMSDTITIVRAGIPVLDALLTEQMQQAKKAGIPFEIDVRIEPEIGIAPKDLCVVLGNLFDNALEACLLLPPDVDRHMKATLLQRNHAIAITIKNTYTEAPKQHQGRGKHGLGLKNVREVLNRYNGHMTISQDDGIYEVSILIP